MTNPQEQTGEFAHTPQSVSRNLLEKMNLSYSPKDIEEIKQRWKYHLSHDLAGFQAINSYLQDIRGGFNKFVGLLAAGVDIPLVYGQDHPMNNNSLRRILFLAAQSERSKREVDLMEYALGFREDSSTARTKQIIQKKEALETFQRQLLECTTPPPPDIRNR